MIVLASAGTVSGTFGSKNNKVDLIREVWSIVLCCGLVESQVFCNDAEDDDFEAEQDDDIDGGRFVEGRTFDVSREAGVAVLSCKRLLLSFMEEGDTVITLDVDFVPWGGEVSHSQCCCVRNSCCSYFPLFLASSSLYSVL